MDLAKLHNNLRGVPIRCFALNHLFHLIKLQYTKLTRYLSSSSTVERSEILWHEKYRTEIFSRPDVLLEN